MKKIVLALITLLGLSSPLRAADIPCVIVDTPCYIKGNVTILKEKPSDGAKVVQKLFPARNDDKLYYYLRKIVVSEGEKWGYFESVTPIIDAMTDKGMKGGWAPLNGAFHDMDSHGWPVIEKENGEGVFLAKFKPDTSVFIIHTRDFISTVPYDKVLTLSRQN